MLNSVLSRQRKILDLLDARHVLTIRELVSELGVSAMTVHRDLNKLAVSGQVAKTHGSVSLPPCARQNAGSPGSCAMCNRAVPERSAVIMQSHQQGRLAACCPHCGLSILDGDLSDSLMLVTDFLCCQMVSAADAAFLVGSDVSSCCRPAVIAFASHEDAKKFQKGFGGEIMGLAGVRDYLRPKNTFQLVRDR